MNSSINLHAKQKQNLNLSLKLWLPILQSPIEELEKVFKDHSYKNPFLSCKSSFEGSYTPSGDGDKSSFIENVLLSKESLYEVLIDQINAPLFPTPRSQKVAQEIVTYIDENGFFDGDIEQIAIKCGVYKEFVESIRLRFAHLEPYGVGAIDLQECFMFQLDRLDLSDELLSLCQKIIKNLSNVHKYKTHPKFAEAKTIIGRLKNPPAIDYMSEEQAIVPDFFVDVGDDINIKINSKYYPDIEIKDAFMAKNDELKEKLKEARSLVSLLELRKSTLYKVILIIVEKQIRFFVGSELRPLTMNEVAQEIGFEESTISRVVANKYIQCSRGLFPLKHFFTNALSKDLSSSEVKNFVKQSVEQEDPKEPLTDQQLVDMIQQRFGLEVVRRTITKYRKQLKILSSKERKKL